MNIFVLIAALILNYFVRKAKQTKTPLAPAVTMAQNEYYPPSPLFLKAVKGHLPRLGEAPLVARALPQVVTPAKYSSLSEKQQRAQIKRSTLNDHPVKMNPKHLITLVSQDG
jgi:hypothetical protein